MVVLQGLSKESDSKWVVGIVFDFGQISGAAPPPLLISFLPFSIVLSPLKVLFKISALCDG